MEPASDNPPAPTSRLRRLVRSLRNLTALGLLTLSLGVFALWVRSYAWADQLYVVPIYGPRYLCGLDSWAGGFAFEFRQRSKFDSRRAVEWRFKSVPTERYARDAMGDLRPVYERLD
jgi:hypothetical protein